MRWSQSGNSLLTAPVFSFKLGRNLRLAEVKEGEKSGWGSVDKGVVPVCV